MIKHLSQDDQDTLMKYLYKGMAMPGWGDISGSVLLGWHEKVSRVCACVCVCPTYMIFFVTVPAGRESDWYISLFFHS